MRWRSGAAVAVLSAALTACDNMANQPKLNPYEVPVGSQVNWPIKPVPHTVARDDSPAVPSPPPVTMALLERGQQRFDIYCSPCHSRGGDGNGIIVQRGFPHPPSYHSQTLRNAPNQLFYDVMTHGYGAMYSYADRVDPADRWAIVAYIRALQASASASLSDVPADKRSALQ
ncbi:c-type cytochrome [Bradyrhizobium sp. STM 3562]|uniref:c-type cytochrome n=1 Tax=Bradyrhizobium sp. STM 3562 TaxID=578924 RepID=UPI003890B433